MQTNMRVPRKLFIGPIRYEIPAFQRRYVWEREDQWEPLWDDVEKLAQSIVDGDRPETHFMGAIVLQQKRSATATMERRIVVDGQQRLTTLQLLTDAIQEVLEKREHSDPAERLADLVENPAVYRRGDPNLAFKVWPTLVDRAAFASAMSNDISAKDHAQSLIVRAHEYFKSQAGQWLDRFPEEGGQRNKAARALEEAVSANLEIVVIDLEGQDDPHVIFETLNARGTPLLQSDMVKNKILHDANVGLGNEASAEESNIWPFAQDKWWNEAVGRGMQQRQRIDQFLNHWLTLRNQSETKQYDEFRIFERYADGKAGKDADDDARQAVANSLAKDLVEIGRIYQQVDKAERTDIARFLERLKVVNVGQVTPLLLWLLSTGVPSKTLTNCVKALESFLVRRAICGYSARSYGDLFVGLLRKLAQGPADNADRILVSYLGEQTAQGTLWPDDKELRDKFVSAPLYQHLTRGRLAMVLTGIEEELRTNKTESQTVQGKLHIEHIMPQAWHSNWPLPDDVSGDAESVAERDRALHTIGNLTLVNHRLNAALSNASWDSKKRTLDQHSVLFLNKRLVDKGPDVWDESAIKKRAQWLHKRAVKIWPHSGDNEEDAAEGDDDFREKIEGMIEDLNNPDWGYSKDDLLEEVIKMELVTVNGTKMTKSSPWYKRLAKKGKEGLIRTLAHDYPVEFVDHFWEPDD